MSFYVEQGYWLHGYAQGDAQFAWSEPLDFAGATLSTWSLPLDFEGETLGPGTVVLVAPLASTGQRITAIPDLAAGDILEWSNVIGGGDSFVAIYSNGTFEAADSVTSFEVRAYDGEWSAWVVQTVGAPIVVEPPVVTPPSLPAAGARLNESANRQAIAATAVRAATFVYIDIPDDPVRVNTSALNIVTGGHTWDGTGALGFVEMVSEDTQIIGAPVRLTLSGVPSALLTDIQTADYRNRRVEVMIGFFDQDWRLLTSLEPVWSGIVDYAHLSVSSGSATVALTCENELAALVGRPIPVRYTDQEQRRRFDGDTFFALLPAMFDLQIEWGGTRVGGGGGGGLQVDWGRQREWQDFYQGVYGR